MATDLDTVLRSRGLRATPQRRFVLDALEQLGHATPDQVWEQVRTASAPMSPSTVYRALELLEELDVVTHTHLGHGPPSYSLATHADHIHLVCHRCGAVQDADLRRAQQLADELVARCGFVADVGHLALDGVCTACAASSSPAPGTKPAS